MIGQSWAPNCEKLKKDFLFDKSLNVVFSEKPNLQNKQPLWTIRWNNLEVPIPIVPYKDIYILPNNNNEYEIWLQTADGVRISLITGKDTLIEDFLRKKHTMGELISKSKGVLFTKELFGGPVKMSAIMKLAYKSTPDLLTCIEKNRINESAIASALILKDTATDNLGAVYEGIGEYDGWMTKSNNDNEIEFSLFVISDNSDQLFNINYKMAENSKFEYLPFYVGSKKKDEKETTGWLVALNKAIETRSNDDWKKFISIAKEIGISERSIAKTSEKLKIGP
ncbi:MAG: hypothetical protein JW927_04595 [Deltaproteobacteria bacterium]|nr:hypothetical protein [Deltaproteobacteria bacterium]